VWQEDVCTLYAGGLSAQHLVGVSMVSISRHPNWGTQPPLGQTGPSIAPVNRYVGETLAGFQLQRGSICGGHVGGEQTHIPPGQHSSPSRWLVANRCVVTKTCRKKAKLVPTPLESFGRLRLKRRVPSSELSRFRPSPALLLRKPNYLLSTVLSR